MSVRRGAVGGSRNRPGSVTTAALADDSVTNAKLANPPVGWVLSNTDGQAFTAAASDETVTWPTEVRDDGGCFTGAAPTIVTIPAGGEGMFGLSAQVGFTNAAGTNFALEIFKNDVIVARSGMRGGGVTGLPTTAVASTYEYCVAGDILSVRVNMDTANETSSTSPPAMRFSGARIYGAL
jgi:hypothetical protein